MEIHEKIVIDGHEFTTTVFNPFFAELINFYPRGKGRGVSIIRGETIQIREPTYHDELIYFPLEDFRKKFLEVKSIEELEFILDQIIKFFYDRLIIVDIVPYYTFYNNVNKYLRRIVPQLNKDLINVKFNIKRFFVFKQRKITLKLKLGNLLVGYYISDNNGKVIAEIPRGVYKIKLIKLKFEKEINREILTNKTIRINYIL